MLSVYRKESTGSVFMVCEVRRWRKSGILDIMYRLTRFDPKAVGTPPHPGGGCVNLRIMQELTDKKADSKGWVWIGKNDHPPVVHRIPSGEYVLKEKIEWQTYRG